MYYQGVKYLNIISINLLHIHEYYYNKQSLGIEYFF
jgi:hypothetical protein